MRLFKSVIDTIKKNENPFLFTSFLVFHAWLYRELKKIEQTSFNNQSSIEAAPFDPISAVTHKAFNP